MLKQIRKEAVKSLKKIAILNDLSGLGKCSLTAAIPVISVMGVQACPLPTAILSNQTGYDYGRMEEKKFSSGWNLYGICSWKAAGGKDIKIFAYFSERRYPSFS